MSLKNIALQASELYTSNALKLELDMKSLWGSMGSREESQSHSPDGRQRSDSADSQASSTASSHGHSGKSLPSFLAEDSESGLGLGEGGEMSEAIQTPALARHSKKRSPTFLSVSLGTL